MIFDENLNLMERDVNFKKSRLGKDNGLGSLFDWIALGSRLFAFGTIRTVNTDPSSKIYESGFIEAEIGRKPFSLEEVRLRVPFDYLDYYLLGHRYVATGSSEGFFLKMGTEAQIFRVPMEAGNPKILNVMPKELARVPRIKNPALGPDDAKALFEEISTYTIPVGIYGYQGKLYLLGRSPSTTTRKTDWWLYQIDPDREKITAKLRLPTSADHVTIVTSPNFWFIFEKGAVKADSTQDIKSLVAIPSRWVTEASLSPLNGAVACSSPGKQKG